MTSHKQGCAQEFFSGGKFRTQLNTMSSGAFVLCDTLKTVTRARDRVPSLAIERPFVVLDTQFTKHAFTIDEV